MESRTHSAIAVGPYPEAPDAHLPTTTKVRAPKLSPARKCHLRSHSCGLIFLSSLASVAAVVLLVFVCNRMMGNRAFHTRARQLSAGRGTKRGFESMCNSDPEGEEAWLDDGNDDYGPSVRTPPIKAPRVGHMQLESIGSLEAQRQVAPTQLDPSTSTLPGKPHAGPWSIEFAASSHRVVGNTSKETEAAEALLLLSMGASSLEHAGGQAAQKAEVDPQPSTSFQARQTTYRWIRQASVVERAEAELPAAPGGFRGVRCLDHPFCRLPVVDREKLLRRFQPAVAVCNGWSNAKPNPLLVQGHDLLLKLRLSPKEAEALTTVAERLCSLVAHDIAPTNSLSIRVIAEYMATRFLYLDIIVAALQVLGESASGPWWEKVTSNVRTRFPCQWEPIPNLRVKTHYSRMVVRELGAALEILKSGRRPDDGELIRLKRMIFCKGVAPRRFRQPVFDKWRADDEPFCKLEGPE